MPQQGAHYVHLRMTRARAAARDVDFFEYHGSRAQRQSGTAGTAQVSAQLISRVSQRFDEVAGIRLARLEISR